MTEEKAQRLITTVRQNFNHALVHHHRDLIESMPINRKDRHVLAAAVACRAQVIVTYNLKDFPVDLLAPFEIDAQSPDFFLTHLHQLDTECMPKILIEQAANLHSPTMTVPDVLNTLEQHAPVFVNIMREFPELSR